MKKILKVVLVLMMAFGIQVAALSNVDAAQVSNLPDGKYTCLLYTSLLELYKLLIRNGGRNQKSLHHFLFLFFSI